MRIHPNPLFNYITILEKEVVVTSTTSFIFLYPDKHVLVLRFFCKLKFIRSLKRKSFYRMCQIKC